jgi:hypothetical protein
MPLLTIYRFMGDLRFDLGVFGQMLKKKGYKCSIATTGNLVKVDPKKPKKDQLQEAKSHVSAHYINEYEHGIMSREDPSRELKALIGTKRPLRKWEHTNHENLHCFYAGKVNLYLLRANEKLPWMSRSANAFPAALSNDGYVDLCLLHENIGYFSQYGVFAGFDKGKHFNNDNVNACSLFLPSDVRSHT